MSDICKVSRKRAVVNFFTHEVGDDTKEHFTLTRETEAYVNSSRT